MPKHRRDMFWILGWTIGIVLSIEMLHRLFAG